MAKKKAAGKPKSAAQIPAPSKAPAKSKPAAKAASPPRSKAAAKPSAALQPAAPSSVQVQPIPAGYHTLTPYLIVRGAAHAIEFYRRAFGAEEVCRLPGPDGFSIGHAEIKIGDSHVMLADEDPQYGTKAPPSSGGTSVSLHMYVADVDAAFQRAVDAGATARMPPTDMFWGDRYGKLVDPFGHEWGLATHKEDVTPEEMARRAQTFYHKVHEPQA